MCRRLVLLGVLAAAVCACAQAAAAPTSDPLKVASQRVGLVAKAFPDWERLRDTHAVLDACAPFSFPGALARAQVSLESRAAATKDASIGVSVAVFPSRQGARKALTDATSAGHLRCMLAWIKQDWRKGGITVATSGRVGPVSAPAALHAGHQAILVRGTGSSSWFHGGPEDLYEYEDIVDPRVLYGVWIDSDTNRPIPAALVAKLLAFGTR